MIKDLPKQAGERAATFLDKYNNSAKANGQIVTKQLEHVVFSDTIVLLLRNEDNAQSPMVHGFGAAADAALRLMAQLFAKGLPSRCVIHEGEFMMQQSCLAGRGIAEAYRLCGELDFSGIVLSNKVRERISGWNPVTTQTSIIFEYLVPLKGGAEKKLLCLNWYQTLDEDDRKACDQDVIQFVSESFWKYNKDLPISTDSKVRNTCKLIRRFKLAMKEPAVINLLMPAAKET